MPVGLFIKYSNVRITGERNTFTGQSQISIIYDLVLWTIVVAQEKQLPANFLDGIEVVDNIVCFFPPRSDF